MWYNIGTMVDMMDVRRVGRIGVASVEFDDRIYSETLRLSIDDETVFMSLMSKSGLDEVVHVRLSDEWIRVDGAHALFFSFHLDGDSIIPGRLVLDGVEYLPSEKCYEDNWLDVVGFTYSYDSNDGDAVWLTLIEGWSNRDADEYERDPYNPITLAVSRIKPIHRDDPFVYINLVVY